MLNKGSTALTATCR